MNRPVLAGAVEGQNIPATLDTGPGAFSVHFLRRSIEARVQDQQRTPGVRFVDAMEVAGQRRVFIRDLHWKNRYVIETAAELICGDRLFVSAINARVFVVAMQEEFGGSKIICC